MPFTTTSTSQGAPFYGGGQVQNPANIILVTSTPSTNATGNPVGTIAINTSTHIAYICVTNTGPNGSVTWDQIGLATGTVGQLSADSGSALPSAGVITEAGGTGLSTSATGSTVTFNVVGGGFKTVAIAGTTQAAVVNTRYTCTNASQTTITLPTTAAVGDSIAIIGNSGNTSGWVLAQNASQVVHFPGGDTTTGATGTVTSNTKYDSLVIVCTVANNEWTVQSVTGTPTRA